MRPNSTTTAMGCMTLFLLPFGAVGLVAAASGVQRGFQGNWREGLLLVLLGMVFAGVAAAVFSLLLVGRNKLREQERLEKAHPDQPWLWRAEWVSGRIADNTRSTLWVAWTFAVFWNLVSIPVGGAGTRAAWEQQNPAGFVVLLFPLIGAGLLVWALRTTLRHRKYGVSWLELSTLPGVVGRSIAGSVRVGTRIEPADGFEVTLRCVRRITTGGGKNRSTSETILWQEERRIQGESSRDTRGFSTRLPIRFAIPADAESSDMTDPNNQIVWRLGVSASVPGVDYASSFDVPVFRTPKSAAGPEFGVEADQPTDPDLEEYRQPSSSRIRVTTNRRGTEILFPALRNPGVAAACVAFTLGWTGIMVALIRFDAPLLFPIVFGLFLILLVIGTLQQCLGVSRAVAQQGSLVLADGYLLLGRERTLSVQDISDITLRIGMQAGSRPYYDIMVVRRNGRQVAAGRWIRDKREAEWLAATLKRVLQLPGRRSEVPAGHDG